MSPTEALSKFLGPAQIETAIDEVAALAKAGAIDIAVAGGVAMQFYGSDRLTKDVDFLATAIPRKIKKVKMLTFGGIAGSTPTGLPVDLIVRDDQYQSLYEEALENSSKRMYRVPFVKREYLAAMKLAARRDKDEIDLKTLIRLGELDLSKTKQIIRRHLGLFAVDEFDSYVAEVEWLKVRDR